MAHDMVFSAEKVLWRGLSVTFIASMLAHETKDLPIAYSCCSLSVIQQKDLGASWHSNICSKCVSPLWVVLPNVAHLHMGPLPPLCISCTGRK